MFFAGKKISPKRFWAASFDNSTLDDILRRACSQIQLIKDNKNLEASFWTGLSALNFYSCVADIHALESALDKPLEINVIQALIENGKQPVERNARKAYNIAEAIQSVFGKGCMHPLVDYTSFAPQLTIEIHKFLMKDIKEPSDVGVYRVTCARPYGSKLMYMAPDLIDGALTQLFQLIRRELLTLQQLISVSGITTEYLSRLIAIAAYFHGQFLFIHPFKNGNGRCAQILLSVILAPFCVVPASLNIVKDVKISRNVYLECLGDGRLFDDDSHDYQLLDAFILDAIDVNTRSACASLDQFP